MRFRLSRRLLIVAGLVLVLVMMILLLLPEVVRRVAVNTLQARITVPVDIDDVDLNLFTGRARVSNLVVKGKDGSRPILQLPTIDIRFSLRALLGAEFALQDILFKKPQLFIERDTSGRFILLEVIRPAEAESGDGGGLKVGRVKIEGGVLTFVDRTTSPAVENVFRDAQLTLTGVNLALDAEPARLDGVIRLEGGTAKVTGVLLASPFSARLKLTATSVPLQSLKGYLVVMLGTRELEREGQFDADLEVAVGTLKQGGLGLEISGTLEGRSLTLGLPATRQPFLTAQRLAIDLTRLVNWPTLQAELARIELIGATLRIERDRDGNLNLARMWASSEQRTAANAPESVPPAPRDTPSRIAIRRFDVAQSRIEFVDASVTPAFSSAISDIRAELLQSSQEGERASLSFEGTLDDSGTLKVSGWFTPFRRPLQLYLEGSLRDYEAARLSPYAENYIRYQIRRGRVTTKYKYRYDAGNLEAKNEFRFRQVDLGDQLGDEFEKRVGIPFKLALALLEDVNGEIRLQVPVSGNLGSPKFSLGNVIWKAVQNALVKALTVPFRVLGKILTVGGKIGEVRIDPIAFLPGSLEPDAEGEQRLAHLTEFLQRKKRLKIQLRGRAVTEEIEPLKRRRLREQIEAVTGATYDQALTRLYRAAGGTESPSGPVPMKEKERFLMDRIVVSEHDLQTLAEERARTIERALARNGIKPQQLFVVGKEKKTVANAPPGRVEFELLY